MNGINSFHYEQKKNFINKTCERITKEIDTNTLNRALGKRLCVIFDLDDTLIKSPPDEDDEDDDDYYEDDGVVDRTCEIFARMRKLFDKVNEVHTVYIVTAREDSSKSREDTIKTLEQHELKIKPHNLILMDRMMDRTCYKSFINFKHDTYENIRNQHAKFFSEGQHVECVLYRIGDRWWDVVHKDSIRANENAYVYTHEERTPKTGSFKVPQFC